MYRKWKIFDRFSEKIAVGFTDRNSGVSHPPYQTFNQALHCGDRDNHVIENRKRLCRELGVPFEYYTCAKQIHSANIRNVTSADKGAGRNNYTDSITDSDALIMRDSGILINIHLADCVPIALYDCRNNIGALIHAGWKGTAALIAAKTAETMIRDNMSKPEDILAGIGPSIGQCCFEIGKDTADTLNKSFSYGEGVISSEKGKWFADLKKANKEQLVSLGVKSENIETSEICTSCSNAEYFSYRADGGQTGRFAAFMLIK